MYKNSYMAAVLAGRVDRPSPSLPVNSTFCILLGAFSSEWACARLFPGFWTLPQRPWPLHLPPCRLQAPSSQLEPALAHSLQAPARSLHRRSGAHPLVHVRTQDHSSPGRTGPDSPVRHATPPIRQLTALELFRCLRRAPAKNQEPAPALLLGLRSFAPSFLLTLCLCFARAVTRSRIPPIRPLFHFKIARKP